MNVHESGAASEFEPQLCDREAFNASRKPYPSTLGVILTERCNLLCRHCISDCSPARNVDLEWPLIQRIVSEAASVPGIRKIGFTGGEPFLVRETLQRAISLCARAGLETSVITNAYWAVHPYEAACVLETLGGLTQLGISCDQFHQEFVPVERVRNAIRAAQELGISAFIRVSYLKDMVSEIESVRRQLADVEGMYQIEHQPVQPGGRAATSLAADELYKYDVKLAICKSADTPAVTTDGRVIACCSAAGAWPRDHLLQVGDVRIQSVTEILAAADVNPVLHIIRLYGPSGLLDLVRGLAESEGVALEPPQATEMCSLCQFLLTDPIAERFVRLLAVDQSTAKDIAIARMSDLGETSMFSRLTASDLE